MLKPTDLVKKVVGVNESNGAYIVFTGHFLRVQEEGNCVSRSESKLYSEFPSQRRCN